MQLFKTNAIVRLYPLCAVPHSTSFLYRITSLLASRRVCHGHRDCGQHLSLKIDWLKRDRKQLLPAHTVADDAFEQQAIGMRQL